jgi:hypothetical protein
MEAISSEEGLSESAGSPWARTIAMEREPVSHLVVPRRVLVHGDEQGESLFALPRLDETIVPHGEDVWVDREIAQGHGVRDDLGSAGHAADSPKSRTPV